MKEFDTPMICITQEEYEQLKECRIAQELWQIYGPYNFSKELEQARNPLPGQYPHSIYSRLVRLNSFDDSE